MRWRRSEPSAPASWAGTTGGSRRSLYFSPAFHGLVHGDLVGVLEVAAYRHALEVARLFNRRHVLRLFHHADHAVVAGLRRAEDARIHLGGVAADRAVGDAIFQIADGVAELIGLLARRPQNVERQTLGALRA